MIELTPALLSRDLEAFIRCEISKSSILSIPDLREQIYTSLRENADGMFLWVKLMVDELQRSSSKFEVATRLRNLPVGLEETYRLTFLRVSDHGLFFLPSCAII